ncbi:hypothetical protein AS156_23115 [Bradyrhizobium macuxiense]|uniref:Phage tail collar domain-containing protein n=1 Tax=Bradyrhizobium macuxiense TaxID=1755647 RepID=A0A125Q5U9_9BRAD|nr:tail fiber protein [Bradyrhizobium macuxiense]KWV45905.1 hypothetical protein AS156_23115 [Bradyrhizobium macuxiense]
MVADNYGSILGLILQGTGNNNNNWGATQNNACTVPTERAIAGRNNINSTGGTVDLSSLPPPAALRQDIDHIQVVTGALTQNVTIIVPNLTKTWLFNNSTTGNFAVHLQAAGAANTIEIPQGTNKHVLCYGPGSGFLARMDAADVGMIGQFAGPSLPGGWMACNGASLLRTDHPDLYQAIGTTWGSVDSLHFTLPNFTDTGRFLRSSSGSFSVGTYLSNQNAAHAHSITGAPSAGTLGTDSQGAHTHSAPVTDPGHAHVPNQAWRFFGNYQNYTSGQAQTGLQINNGSDGSFFLQNSTTGISVSISLAGAHTHNITGAPGVGTLGTGSQGGSEARPESAVVLFGIRY